MREWLGIGNSQCRLQAVQHSCILTFIHATYISSAPTMCWKYSCEQNRKTILCVLKNYTNYMPNSEDIVVINESQSLPSRALMMFFLFGGWVCISPKYAFPKAVRGSAGVHRTAFMSNLHPPSLSTKITSSSCSFPGSSGIALEPWKPDPCFPCLC